MTVPAFEHIGLLHQTPADYAQGCAAFILKGLRAAAPVLVAVPEANTNLICAALGSRAGEVEFIDMTTAGRNPGRVIPWVLLEFADRHPDRRVWLISQAFWPSRSDIEYPACVEHDAMINAAFAGRDAAILCPFDLAGLPARAFVDAHLTHPIMVDGANVWHSPHYSDPMGIVRMSDQPLPAPPGSARRFSVANAGDLRRLREAVTAEAQAILGDPIRVKQLVLAVNELATNSIEHGSGNATVTLWTESGVLVCQIDDEGVFDNRMAGLTPPPPGSDRGRGLLIVHELADLVRISHHPGGTTVRLHIDIPNNR